MIFSYASNGPGVPEGLWDILPGAAKKRRALEARLRDAFEGRLYGEVICPTFEFYDNLAVEMGPAVKGDMVRFMGSDGRLLALRPEMTTAIARVVAQRLRPKDEPHRLYYISNVFREHPSKQEQPREFWQAGVERIGGGTVEDDTEILALFIETLSAAGIKDFQVGLGRIDFLGGILAALQVEELERERMRAALAARSLVEYESIVRGHGFDGPTTEKLLAVPGIRGGAPALELARSMGAGDQAEATIDEMGRLYANLEEAGYADRVVVDFGLIRDFGYYTGMVFEAYVPGFGATLGGGGRYDKLLAEFGYASPAAGFALGLERLERACELTGADR